MSYIRLIVFKPPVLPYNMLFCFNVIQLSDISTAVAAILLIILGLSSLLSEMLTIPCDEERETPEEEEWCIFFISFEF